MIFSVSAAEVSDISDVSETVFSSVSETDEVSFMLVFPAETASVSPQPEKDIIEVKSADNIILLKTFLFILILPFRLIKNVYLTVILYTLFPYFSIYFFAAAVF